MKLCIYSDLHWTYKSSMFSMPGDKYSKRTINLLDTLKWVGDTAKKNSCDRIICAGDFFDKNYLNYEEITALKDVDWTDIPKQFLLGNHELGRDSNELSNLNSLNALNGVGEIIDSPKLECINGHYLVFLPYDNENYQVDLKMVLNRLFLQNNEKLDPSKTIIISHNDLKGIQYGKFLSTSGYSIGDIEDSCVLYLNGHLHNGEKITDKVINIGNVTGLNFTEDAFKYKHGLYILDTDTFELNFYENPYAVGFYKVNVFEMNDLSVLSKINSPAIISVKVRESLLDLTLNRLKLVPNLIAHKEIIIPEKDVKTIANVESLQKVDYLIELQDFCLDKIGDFEALKEELVIICKN